MIQFHNLELCDLVEGLWLLFVIAGQNSWSEGHLRWTNDTSRNKWHFEKQTTQSKEERSIPFPLIIISVRSWIWIGRINSLSFSSISSLKEDDLRRLVSLRGKNTYLTVGDSIGEELSSFSLIGSQIWSIPLPFDQSDHQIW